MLHKKYVMGSKLHETGTFKGIIRFYMDLNNLSTSVSIKIDFEVSLQIHECDYKQVYVKLSISKKKAQITYLSTYKLFFFAWVHHFAKDFSHV